MKNLIFLFFAFSLSYIPLFSEEERNFISIGADSGYLIDGLMKNGWGAGGIIEIKLLDKFSLAVDSGYIEYKEITNNITNRITSINVFGSFRWYPSGGISGIFAGAGFGTFYTTVSDNKIQGYLFPIEAGLKITFFGQRGISLEPDLTILLKYGNSRFLFGMKYGVNIGYTF